MQYVSVSVSGITTFWALKDGGSHAALKDAFAAAGLAHLAPAVRTPRAALRLAVEDAAPLALAAAAGEGGRGGRGRPDETPMVRPLRKMVGFAVVREARGDEANEYVTLARVRFPREGESVPTGGLVFAPECPQGFRDAVRGQFVRHVGGVPVTNLIISMVQAAAALGGTLLRPAGGVYWVPQEGVAAWAGLAQAVSACGGGEVYATTCAADERMAAAVEAAIRREVEAEASRMTEEVFSGSLKGRALRARKQQAESLRQKVLAYEGHVGRSLESLRRCLEEVETAIAGAAVQAAGEPAAA